MLETYLSSNVEETYCDIEVNMKGVSKGKSLAALAQRLGIPQQYVVAFGDGSNDSEMLEYAGTGVAMGSASEEGKSQANMVTLDGGQEGSAVAWKQWNLI